MATEWDTLVIGLGAVGAQALWQLARRGARVLGVDARPLGHDEGSSHGRTRAYRHAYFEHPDYVPLLRPATAEFRALEEASGARLLEPCGVLLAGDSDSVLVGASAEAAQRFGVEAEQLDAQQLRARYPQLAVGDATIGLFEPDAGFVRCEEAIRVALEQAEACGASIVRGARVVGLEEGASSVTVTLGTRVERARSVVVAAGAWTSGLLPSLAPHLRVTRQVQAWVAPSDAQAAEAERLPCWLLDRGAERALYGVPIDPLASDERWAKVAVHGSDVLADPDRVERRVHAEDLREIEEGVARGMPGLAGRVAHASVCRYTMTPDEHFLVDAAPGHRRVFFAAGLSGHGFKLSPALGVSLAELALTGASSLPIGFLGLSRLEPSA